MSLSIIIKTKYKGHSVYGSNVALKVLKEEGLTILGENELKFTESYNFTTHSGENNRKLFLPLLKGNLIFPEENNWLLWNIEIDNIVFRSLLLAILSFLMFYFLSNSGLLIALFISIAIGVLIFIINREVLRTRLNKISNKIGSWQMNNDE